MGHGQHIIEEASKKINERNRSAKRVRQFVPPLTLQTM